MFARRDYLNKMRHYVSRQASATRKLSLLLLRPERGGIIYSGRTTSVSLTEASFLSLSLFLSLSFSLPRSVFVGRTELHSPCPCCVPNRAHTGFLCFAEIHEPRRTCRFRGSFVRTFVRPLSRAPRFLTAFCSSFAPGQISGGQDIRDSFEWRV